MDNRKQVCDSIKNLIMIIYIIYYNIKKSEDITLFFKMNKFNITNILIKAIKLLKDDKKIYQWLILLLIYVLMI